MISMIQTKKMLQYLPLIEVCSSEPPPPAGKPLVVLLHGGGGNKQHVLPLAEQLAERGYFCICPDLANHGERIQPGRPLISPGITAQTTRDLELILQQDRSLAGVDGTRVGLVGQSLGGAMAFNYLTKHADRIKAVCTIVATPNWLAVDFQAAIDMMTHYLASQKRTDAHLKAVGPLLKTYLFCRQPMNHLRMMRHTALLLLNGCLDPIVRLSGVEAFYRKMTAINPDRQRVRLIAYPDVGHQQTPAMIPEILAFLDRYV
jgi:alpha-beta hydrolase superfamily lysophospholipase